MSAVLAVVGGWAVLLFAASWWLVGLPTTLGLALAALVVGVIVAAIYGLITEHWGQP